MRVPVDVVSAAIEQVLQKMYFCDAVFSGASPLSLPAVGAGVAFSGAMAGEFRVAISVSLAARVATDFLALDAEAVTFQQIDATLREFANIACGAALNAWLPSGDFHFEIPHTLEAEVTAMPFPLSFSLSGDTPEIGVEIAIEPV
jgi:hypothetical protein